MPSLMPCAKDTAYIHTFLNKYPNVHTLDCTDGVDKVSGKMDDGMRDIGDVGLKNVNVNISPAMPPDGETLRRTEPPDSSAKIIVALHAFVVHEWLNERV